MKFQLPQFIETEAKLVGPLTPRQFLWCAAGVVFIVVLFLSLPPWWALVLSIPTGALAAAFAFIKVGGMALATYATHALSFALNPRRYHYRIESPNDTDVAPPGYPPL